MDSGELSGESFSVEEGRGGKRCGGRETSEVFHWSKTEVV